MNYIDILQTQTHDEAKAAIFGKLSALAVTSLTEDTLVESVRKTVGQYSEKNPKIDLHNKHNGIYIASTNWSPNVKHAVAAYEDKYPEMKGHVRGYIAKNESVEQLDELSKSTLGSYIKKATYKVGINMQQSSRSANEHPEVATKLVNKAKSVANGISKATDRLTKESVEQLDFYSDVVSEGCFKKGEEVGKPGLNFDKIADKAAKKYGSKEAGERVAGSVLKKVLKEELSDEEIDTMIDESVKKVGEHTEGRHSAKIYKDSNLGEYQVKLHTDGKHLPDADYFTDDKDDAHRTAKSECSRMSAKDEK